MTIAAGFKCHEGVLLATDTLYAGVNKRYGRKIWPIACQDILVGFAGAGTQAGLERTQYEVQKYLGADMDVDDVIGIIQSALQLVLDVSPSDDKTQGLFAIQMDGTCTLFENAAGSAMLSPVGHASQCVGWAQALGQYFQDFLYREPMPMKWARIVASHLIRQAKTYSEYCGGDTHLLEIPDKGAWSFVTNQEEITAYEKYLGQLDDAMRAVLPDGRANDYTLELRLNTIAEAIKKSGNSFVMQAESGSFSIESGSTSVTAHEIPRPQIRYGFPPAEEK